MPVAGGGFEQCYNAQAAVAADSLLVVAVDVVQARQRQAADLNRCWVRLRSLPGDLGRSGNVAGGHWLFQRGERDRVQSRPGSSR